MTGFGGINTEKIRDTIAYAQTVYDKAGKKAGNVDAIFYDTGYFIVLSHQSPEGNDGPFEEQHLYVPFRLITTINTHELFVSVTVDELRREYAARPELMTVAVETGDGEVAITTEKSGYTGAPIVVDRVKIDRLKDRIAVGDHVFTVDMIDLGKIRRYDKATGWMLVERHPQFDRHDLLLPVTLVEAVNRNTQEVYLVTTQSDLQRMQHLEPVHVVFVDTTVHQGS